MVRALALLVVAILCGGVPTAAATDLGGSCAFDDASCHVGDEQSLIHLRQQRSKSPEIMGYYAWSWSAGGYAGPPGTNLDVCFNGYSGITDAMSNCATLVGSLSEEKWISIGGNGNPYGVITAEVLTSTAAAASTFLSAGYKGVIFDVEVVQGTNEALTQAFLSSSADLKAAGLKVGITTSHSGPFEVTGGADAVTLVKTWVSDPNLGIISPQLYSSGNEDTPQFDTTWNCPGCTWDLYKGSIAKFAPSIVSTSQYAATETYFTGIGITTAGYMQWAQETSSLSGNYCGTIWEDANTKCATPCDDTDAACAPLGESCWRDLTGCR